MDLTDGARCSLLVARCSLLVAVASVGRVAFADPGGPHEWSRPAPRGLHVGDTETVGAITWEYVGQAKHAIHSRPAERVVHVTQEAGWADYSPVAQIIGSRRTKADGTEWIAVDVDTDRLQVSILQNGPYDQPADAFLEALTGPVDTTEWIDAADYLFEPESWTHPKCAFYDAEGKTHTTTYNVFDGEDWTVQASADDWERAVVWLTVQFDDGIGTCGGVLIDDDEDWVLTAAHCLYDTDNYRVDEADVTVCAVGNRFSDADCDTVANELHTNPYWNPVFWNPADDYALIKVDLSTSYEPMQVSTYSDAYVDNFTMRTHAYPLWESVEPLCDRNSDFDGKKSIVDPYPFKGAREMVSSFGPLAAPVGQATYHITIDGGPGFSGSPVWFCGDASCAAGDTGYVVGVWNGWQPLYTTEVANKARTYNWWVAGTID